MRIRLTLPRNSADDEIIDHMTFTDCLKLFGRVRNSRLTVKDDGTKHVSLRGPADRHHLLGGGVRGWLHRPLPHPQEPQPMVGHLAALPWVAHPSTLDSVLIYSRMYVGPEPYF